MSVFVNRILNMKSIKAIGFDMDHTLARYNTQKFEHISYEAIQKKLVKLKGYPSQILDLKFDFNLVILGLVIDKQIGTVLKVSRFGKVKDAFLGLKRLEYKYQKKIYRNRNIDLTLQRYQSLDTPFSISNGVIFMQIMQLKQDGIDFPEPSIIADDLREVIDIAHADDTLKSMVREDLKTYILQTPELATQLEKFKLYGKKLLIITNSEFYYTKLILEYIIDPFLKHHKSWMDLFEITITLSRKPTFFNHKNPFLKIDPETSLMSNFIGKLVPGIYQGGWAGKLEADLGLNGDQILYIGDHIFGDVVSLKKAFNWRTAFVQASLEKDLAGHKKVKEIQDKINILMKQKEDLEDAINILEADKIERNIDRKEEESKLFKQIDQVNKEITPLLTEYNSHFNQNFGEIMRSGIDESHFANQVEEYACIYMAHVTDFLSQSPLKYYRPHKRLLSHELH